MLCARTAAGRRTLLLELRVLIEILSTIFSYDLILNFDVAKLSVFCLMGLIKRFLHIIILVLCVGVIKGLS